MNDKQMNEFVKAVLEFQRRCMEYEYAWHGDRVRENFTTELETRRALLLKARRRLFYLFRKARKE